MYLSITQQWIEQRAAIVDGDVAQQFDAAGIEVDLDDRAVRAERETRRCLHELRDSDERVAIARGRIGNI